jgi:hypothetical protein
MEVSGELHAPAALPPGKKAQMSITYEAGWAPEPVRSLCRREKFISLAEYQPRFHGRSAHILLTIPSLNKAYTRYTNIIHTDYIASENEMIMNDKLGRMRKENAMTCLDADLQENNENIE